VVKRKDVLLLAVFLGGFSGLAVAVGRLGADLAPAILASLVVTVVAVLGACALRWLQRQFADQNEQAMATYHQLESLVWLSNALSVRQPLPAMRTWAISPDFAATLFSLLRGMNWPVRILELGGGVSTVIAGYCIREQGGHIVSLDHDADYAERTRRTLEQHGLSDLATVLHAPLIETPVDGQSWCWYDLRDVPDDRPFDLLIVDGPPAATQALARYPALPMLLDRLAPDAVVLVDDAHRADDRATIARWLETSGEFTMEDVATEKGAAILRRMRRSEIGKVDATTRTDGAEALQRSGRSRRKLRTGT